MTVDDAESLSLDMSARAWMLREVVYIDRRRIQVKRIGEIPTAQDGLDWISAWRYAGRGEGVYCDVVLTHNQSASQSRHKRRRGEVEEERAEKAKESSEATATYIYFGRGVSNCVLALGIRRNQTLFRVKCGNLNAMEYTQCIYCEAAWEVS